MYKHLIMIRDKRKYTRKQTKKKLLEAYKLLFMKGNIYSYNELYRLWLEHREIMYYLKPYLKRKKVHNNYWNDRFNLKLNDKGQKILSQNLKEIILFQDKETIKLIKLLF